MKTLEDWAKIFKEPAELIETLTMHWLLHEKAVKKDISAWKADWAADNYFKAGADIADAVTLMIGPIKKEYLHILQWYLHPRYGLGYQRNIFENQK